MSKTCVKCKVKCEDLDKHLERFHQKYSPNVCPLCKAWKVNVRDHMKAKHENELEKFQFTKDGKILPKDLKTKVITKVNEK